MKKQKIKTNKKRRYRIVTKEELIEKIRKNSLGVYYYAHIFEHSFDIEYDSLVWDTELLITNFRN